MQRLSFSFTLHVTLRRQPRWIHSSDELHRQRTCTQVVAGTLHSIPTSPVDRYYAAVPWTEGAGRRGKCVSLSVFTVVPLRITCIAAEQECVGACLQYYSRVQDRSVHGQLRSSFQSCGSLLQRLRQRHDHTSVRAELQRTGGWVRPELNSVKRSNCTIIFK